MRSHGSRHAQQQQESTPAADISSEQQSTEEPPEIWNGGAGVCPLPSPHGCSSQHLPRRPHHRAQQAGRACQQVARAAGTALGCRSPSNATARTRSISFFWRFTSPAHGDAFFWRFTSCHTCALLVKYVFTVFGLGQCILYIHCIHRLNMYSQTLDTQLRLSYLPT